MDEFAQTRGADDLFDDEIIPVEQPEVQYSHHEEEQQQAEQQKEEAAVAEELAAGAQEAASQRGGRGRGRGNNGRGFDRGRGRGRGNGRGGARGRDNNAPVSQSGDKSRGGQGEETKETSEGATAQGNENGEDTDKKAKEPETQRVYAVRGDRSGTGGVRKPKLTEDELSERMAAAKIAAEKRRDEHARAEADQASFQERERIAAEKRRVEYQNRRAMIGERDKNRQRKLAAQTGREWDAEKSAQDFSDRGRGGSQYRRGAHGGIAYDGQRGSPDPGAEQQLYGDVEGGNGFFRGWGGRGYRGGRGRGGRGRGDYFNNDARRSPQGPGKEAGQEDQKPPAIEAESEFPALPAGATPSKQDQAPSITTASANNANNKTSQSDLDNIMTPITPGGTWADQMETNNGRKADVSTTQPTGETEKAS